VVSYPELATMDTRLLVPPEKQPTYLPLDGATPPGMMNLSAEIIDRRCDMGWGNRPAIFFADERRTLTFDELRAHAQSMAGALKGLGLRTGERVAVRFPNRPEGIIAMFAVWYAGGAVLPVPPQARAAELPDYIADVSARFLITYEAETDIAEVRKAGASLGVEHIIAGPDGRGTPFHSWRNLVASSSPLLEPVLVPADMPAVCWHTGGTTGKPKCCYHTAGQYFAAGKAAGRLFQLDPDHDVHLGFPGPIGHAAGMIGRTNVSLLNGVPYVEVEQMADPQALLNAISDYGVTWVMAIAITWARMLRIYRQNPDAYDLSRLSKAFGPMMSVVAQDVYDGWVEAGHPVQNVMGSTQFATWFLAPPVGGKFPAGCIGFPAPGYEAKIIDAKAPGFSELPPGSVGLLCLRGPSGLTYWNRPEMQGRDVRDGWTVMDDLARMEDDGSVWYLGRSDFMINSAGYKIAPAEVEEAVGHHPDVAEVAVVGSPDPERGEVVTAFIVLKDRVTSDEAVVRDIQEFVKQAISPYKYPRRIIIVPGLPRDLVGKVQVSDLRKQAAEMNSAVRPGSAADATASTGGAV
jgi:2-aminobenzoate-CoA ligase